MFNKKYRRPISIIVTIAFLFFPNSIYAQVASDTLPTGGSIVSGEGTIHDPVGNTLDIDQESGRMIANWDGFSIGSAAAVNFYQPGSSAIALNRVTGINPSEIFGALNATGKIFLINPAGILFGQGCRIDTSGMVASTLNITDTDFLAGRYTFYGQGGSVVNQGYISTPGGYAALLGSTVENAGIIEADLGSVVLASGEAITLNLDPQGLISVVVDEATTQNLEGKEDAVANTGTITADGGKVILTAQALDGVFDNAINTTGIIEANAIDDQGGVIELTSNEAINSTGDMSAEGGTIKICTDDGLTLGGSYIADSIIFDPDWDLYVGSLLGLSGDTTFYSTGDIHVTEDVSSVSGFLKFFADATDESNTRDDGIGDFNQNPGTTISGTDNIEISGVNINIDGGTIEAIANPIGFVQVDLSADSAINITNNSSILADYNGTGRAQVNMEAGTRFEINGTTEFYGGTINLDNSLVKAQVDSGFDSARVFIGAKDITINNSDVIAEVVEDGRAEVEIQAGDWREVDNGDGGSFDLEGGSLDILNGSSVIAQVGVAGDEIVGSGIAEIDLASGGAELAATINIDASSVIADVEGIGEADIEIFSGNLSTSWGEIDNGYEASWFEQVNFDGGELNILNDSTILANIQGNPDDSIPELLEAESSAVVELGAGDITIGAESGTDSTSITAQVSGTGDATVEMRAADHYHSDRKWMVEVDDPYVVSFSENEYTEGGSILIQNVSDSVLAKVDGTVNHENARVTIEAEDIRIINSAIAAELTGYGNATVEIHAFNFNRNVNEEVNVTNFYGWHEYDGTEYTDYWGGDLEIVNSSIEATVLRPPEAIGEGPDPRALVEMQAGSIVVDSSSNSINADFTGDGEAEVSIGAADYVREVIGGYWGWEYVREGCYGGRLEDLWWEAEEWIESDHYGGTIDILNGSSINATATENYAGVFIQTGQEGDVEQSAPIHYGPGYINILGDSEVNAYVNNLTTENGYAEVDIQSKDITIDNSSVKAEVVEDGEAYVWIYAGDYKQLAPYENYDNAEFWTGGTLNINDSSILAKIGSGMFSAGVDIDGKDVTIDNSSVTAQVLADGEAWVEIEAVADWSKLEKRGYSTEQIWEGGTLNILNGSSILATVGSNGSAYVGLFSGGPEEEEEIGTTTIDNSSVKAEVVEQGNAGIEIYSGNYREYQGYNSYEETLVDSTINILNGSLVLATIGSGFESAGVEIQAKDINIDNSQVTAEVKGEGNANVEIKAENRFYSQDYYMGGWTERYEGGTLNILNGSSILATVGSNGSAYVGLFSGGPEPPEVPATTNINNSSVTAEVVEVGNANIEIYSGNYSYQEGYGYQGSTSVLDGTINILNGSSILAKIGSGMFSAGVDIAAKDITINNSSVTAQVLADGYAYVDIAAGNRDSYWGYGYYGYDGGSFWDGTLNILNGSSILSTVGGFGWADVCLESGAAQGAPDTTTIDNSSVVAQVLGDGNAYVGIYGGSWDRYNDFYYPDNSYGNFWPGTINILNGASVRAYVAGSGHAEVYVDTTGEENFLDLLLGSGPDGDEGDITISGSGTLVQAESHGTDGYGPPTSLVTISAADDLVIGSGSTVSAYATGDGNPALVLAIAGDSIYAPGMVSAVSTDFLAAVAMLAPSDVYAGGVLASGSNYDVIPCLEDLIGYLFPLPPITIGAQYTYGGLALIGSLYGDVTLGDITADVLLAAALGLDECFLDTSEGYGAILNAPGDISAHFTYLLARNDIGTSDNPIATDVDILAGYSFDTGSIYIDQVTSKLIELGLYLPIYIGEEPPLEQIAAVGASLAANDGIVSVTSDGDMIINSIISANGGVFLQSRTGSIYAGTGWDPALHEGDVPDCLEPFLMDFPWDEGPDYLSPIMIICSYGENHLFAPNVIAAGYSYFSTPIGTIGVGTLDSKDPANSGQIFGYVNPAIVGYAGQAPSFSLDFRFGVPPGYVLYDGEGMVQVWPPILAPDPGALTFDNPLIAYVDVIDGAHSALPDGFPAPGEALAGLTLQIGGFIPPDNTAAILANPLMKYLRAYYELLDGFRVVYVEPAKPTEFFGYHPLTPTDSTAFDEIALDIDFYEFIAGMGRINLKKTLAPYFGEEEEEEKKR